LFLGRAWHGSGDDIPLGGSARVGSEGCLKETEFSGNTALGGRLTRSGGPRVDSIRTALRVVSCASAESPRLESLRMFVWWGRHVVVATSPGPIQRARHGSGEGITRLDPGCDSSHEECVVSGDAIRARLCDVASLENQKERRLVCLFSSEAVTVVTSPLSTLGCDRHTCGARHSQCECARGVGVDNG
jgi:hypothetical protein